MHYYNFNIADYRKDTAHLSPMEHYIYRQLIDWCYLDESGIPKKTQSVLRRLCLDSESEQLLQNVLEDFFIEQDHRWIHPRIEQEIEKYHSRSIKNAENAKKGGRPKNKEKQQLRESEKPKKTQSVSNEKPNQSEINPNQEPITNNQEPITNKTKPPPGGIPFAKIRDVYNQTLGDKIPRCRNVTPQREKHIRARIAEDPEKRIEVGWWEKYFTVVADTPFLLGHGPPRADTGKPWAGADFDWLINAENMNKILEGKYERKS